MEQPKILVAGATGKTGRVEHGAQLTECPATERRAMQWTWVRDSA
jgi:hypothetical protein